MQSERTHKDSDILRILGEAARPRLKLFLSADIVGSTAHKQRLVAVGGNVGLSDDWPNHIQQFYKEISEEFRSSWMKMLATVMRVCSVSMPHASQELFGPPPVFWKTIGDEVVFWKELQTEDQIWFALLAWFDALAQVRASLKRAGLDVKATAWTAGFPVRNRAISNRELSSELDAALLDGYDKKSKDFLAREKVKNPALANAILIDRYYRDGSYGIHVDFIGSGIDVGFRISKHATTRKMTLSVDLVYLMAISFDAQRINKYMTALTKSGVCQFNENIGRVCDALSSSKDQFPVALSRLGVYYSGMEPLKGVLGGVDYPIFWINTEEKDSLDSRKSDLDFSRVVPKSWDTLRNFCHSFYEDRKNFIFPPFIHDESKVDGAVSSSTYITSEIDERLNVARIGIGLLPERPAGDTQLRSNSKSSNLSGKRKATTSH